MVKPDVMSKSAATRIFIEATDVELPSVSAFTRMAAKVKRGQKHDVGKDDDSGILPTDKLHLLKVRHEEMAHRGGRQAIVDALKEERMCDVPS